MVWNQFFHQDRANADKYWVSALNQVCNFTQVQSRKIILDGYDNIESFIY